MEGWSVISLTQIVYHELMSHFLSSGWAHLVDSRDIEEACKLLNCGFQTYISQKS